MWKCKCWVGGVRLTENLVDEGNYTVNPEANGKHNNPIWIFTAVLIASRVGGKEEKGQEGATKRRVDYGSGKRDCGEDVKVRRGAVKNVGRVQ